MQRRQSDRLQLSANISHWPFASRRLQRTLRSSFGGEHCGLDQLALPFPSPKIRRRQD